MKEILYKYVSAERILTCLPRGGKGTLRATQPGALNDPFEFAVMLGLVEKNERDGDRKLAEVLTGINEVSPVNEFGVEKAREEHGSLYLRQLLTEQLSRRFGIVAFATDPRHPLMWSHYAAEGSGFVIGYDAQQLEKLSSRDGCLRSVRYSDKLTALVGQGVFAPPPPDNLNALLSLKSEHWSYEEEWRLIVELSETIGTGDEDQYGWPINLLPIPNAAVESVYFTELTPPNIVKMVRRRLANPNYRYQARVIKLVMSQKHYGYEDTAPDPLYPPEVAY